MPLANTEAFQEQRRAVGGRGLPLLDIVRMLQVITSSMRTLVCIDALDECEAVHRVKVLDSLKHILEKSQSMRIFIIGRLHIRAEVERHLSGRVMSVSIGSKKMISSNTFVSSSMGTKPRRQWTRLGREKFWRGSPKECRKCT